MVLNGPINRIAFETYVAKVLVPELNPGDVVVMDNLSSHKGPRVREMIEAAGAELRYAAPEIRSCSRLGHESRNAQYPVSCASDQPDAFHNRMIDAPR